MAKLEVEAANKDMNVLAYISEQDAAMGDIIGRIIKSELDNTRKPETARS